jgi:CBS-domain-containing membrane protein
MLKARISGLPVVDDRGKLVGVISEGDFLHRAEIGTERKYSPWYDALFGSGETATAYTRAHGLKVAEIMTNKVITTTGTSPLHMAVELMERHHIKRLPVMGARKVVGIIPRANLMRALASIHRETPKTSRNDAAIRKAAGASLRTQLVVSPLQKCWWLVSTEHSGPWFWQARPTDGRSLRSAAKSIRTRVEI